MRAPRSRSLLEDIPADPSEYEIPAPAPILFSVTSGLKAARNGLLTGGLHDVVKNRQSKAETNAVFIVGER